MRAFMDAGGFTFPVMLDVNGVFGAYGVDALPTIVIVDAEGQVAGSAVGGASAEDLSEAIDQLTL